MKIESKLVICYTVNPETGNKMLVEITPLILLETTFYDDDNAISDEVTAVCGHLTVIAHKVHRVHMVDPSRVDYGSVNGPIFYEVTVGWEDLETKPVEAS